MVSPLYKERNSVRSPQSSQFFHTYRGVRVGLLVTKSGQDARAPKGLLSPVYGHGKPAINGAIPRNPPKDFLGEKPILAGLKYLESQTRVAIFEPRGPICLRG